MVVTVGYVDRHVAARDAMVKTRELCRALPNNRLDGSGASHAPKRDLKRNLHDPTQSS
jgi:hypothetical protein